MKNWYILQYGEKFEISCPTEDMLWFFQGSTGFLCSSQIQTGAFNEAQILQKNSDTIVYLEK